MASVEPDFPVVVGELDVTPWLVNASFRTSIRDRPSARVQLDAAPLVGEALDYFGEVTLGTADERGHPFFGSVVDAGLNGETLDLQCEAMPELATDVGPTLEAFGVTPPEVFHLIMRTAGLREDQLRIAALDSLPYEAIETLVPLRGIEVNERVDLQHLSLLPLDEAEPLLTRFDGDRWRRFQDGVGAYAVVYNVGNALFEAESLALAAVDLTLAWLNTRGRYGLAYLPDGKAQTFNRVRARSNPTVGGFVMTGAVGSGRAWLHSIGGGLQAHPLILRSAEHDWMPPDPQTIGFREGQAMLALRRAANDPDIAQRIQALWEALEFLIASTSVVPRFTPDEVAGVIERLPTDNPELHARAAELLRSSINSPPLMARLRACLANDGVPFLESEFDLLVRLRHARNQAVHGRQMRQPPAEDVDRAVSVVARIVILRLAATTAKPE